MAKTKRKQKRGTTKVKKRTSSQLKRKTPQNTKRIPKARRRTGVRYGAGRKFFLDCNAFVIKQNTKIER